MFSLSRELGTEEEEVAYNSNHSQPQHQMEVNVHLQAPAILKSGKNTVQEAGRAGLDILVTRKLSWPDQDLNRGPSSP